MVNRLVSCSQDRRGDPTEGINVSLTRTTTPGPGCVKSPLPKTKCAMRVLWFVGFQAILLPNDRTLQALFQSGEDATF
jgi:hypothetical protein